MASLAEDERSPGAEEDSEDNEMAEEHNQRASSEDKSPNRGGTDTNNKPAAKSNAKDPSRPRRKKARRACFACQRAHLTCGDERPCLRCIKRGLQDQCHDGVRKKAKYLHDAPAEALIPGFAGNYSMNGSNAMQTVPGAPQMGSVRPSQSGAFYAPGALGGYPHNQITHQGSMPPQIVQSAGIVGDYTAPAMDPSAQFHTNSNQQISPVQTMATTMDQSSVLGSAAGSFDNSYIDPNDPQLFNFNISEMNFGNRYGAMELGMLGQMSSGAFNTPDVEGMGMHSNQGSISYEGLASNFGYDQAFQPWQSVPNFGVRQNSAQHLWTLNNHDYVVGEAPSSVTGGSDAHDFNTGYSSSTVSPEIPFSQPEEDQSREGHRQLSSQVRSQKRKRVPFPDDVDQTYTPKKARRNTAEIYESVKEPYPYTQGFHNLTPFTLR